MIKTDVLILGAGAAGLTAAAKLARRGINTVVLEARGRVGGRIWTKSESIFSNPKELGAEFVHGEAPRTVRMLEDFGLKYYEVSDRHAIASGGHLREVPDFWERIDPALEARPEDGDDCSFNQSVERLRMSDESKSLARPFVEGFHAADPDEISQAALSEESEATSGSDGKKLFRVVKGYGALMDELASQACSDRNAIFLQSPVNEIRWERGYVEAHVGDGEDSRIYVAKAMILTAPPGPLAKIRFVPDTVLASKSDALRGIRSGAVMKVVVKFWQRFWLDARGQEFSFAHAPKLRHFPTWWSAQPRVSPMLVGWTGGSAARELSGLSPQEVRANAIDSLTHVFGMNRWTIEDLVESFDCHDWQTDPYSEGAYSYLGVGASRVPSRLAEPFEDTLFFGGEATEAAGMGGTVESAIQSGTRAANEVLASFRVRTKLTA